MTRYAKAKGRANSRLKRFNLEADRAIADMHAPFTAKYYRAVHAWHDATRDLEDTPPPQAPPQQVQGALPLPRNQP